MKSPADIVLEAMEEWADDESIADNATFAEWAREHRPDLVPLLDSLPPPSRALPSLPPDEDDE